MPPAPPAPVVAGRRGLAPDVAFERAPRPARAPEPDPRWRRCPTATGPEAALVVVVLDVAVDELVVAPAVLVPVGAPGPGGIAYRGEVTPAAGPVAPFAPAGPVGVGPSTPVGPEGPVTAVGGGVWAAAARGPPTPTRPSVAAPATTIDIAATAAARRPLKLGLRGRMRGARQRRGETARWSWSRMAPWARA